MAQAFEYLELQNPSAAEVIQAGSVGWELVEIKGTAFWFKRPIIA